ncbi:hypothetical protein [Burkholderia dolosa]|uniref:hypothetical protein n=1 Tax=Burkholderia dolosa TaxID=152500 RepID=UPI001590671A|nr:hypothetical protein [Burkholderia dolosa]MBY4751557.1 hypothetical protein [Burkholderia dolosa]MBY4831129.1 hypothetical protein [Burkholderia dolosa]
MAPVVELMAPIGRAAGERRRRVIAASSSASGVIAGRRSMLDVDAASGRRRPRDDPTSSRV